ncbi:MAG: deoxyguanosinetriphosphate triphosphohydrolase [Rhodospirillales bacterium]|nr:deoxyguanosinetriphosphate triphosphohydrolase [Rhodospirillales bacterium]
MTTGSLAPYACDPAQSRGRRFPEPESRSRSVFQRDRDRIVHCRAFRRLMHKTQVFIATEGDHFRTRLTHSLEVAQIARSVARSLRLNEDLAEAVSLAHDLGHTPFGHAGEDVLDAAMEAWGGFDHNVQTLRILTELETRYADFDGLNLTWEALEGVVKHNGPIAGEVPRAIRDYCAVHDLQVDTFAGAEAQTAAIADDIAYHSHDIDDGLRAGLFTLDDLLGAPLAGDAAREVIERYPGAASDRLVQETVRRIINRLVGDLTEESRLRIAESGVESADDVRWHGAPVIAFSPSVAEANTALKAWLFTNMYHHDRVKVERREAAELLRALFAIFSDSPQHLPEEWRHCLVGRDETARMRVIADYIAGMSDRFAQEEHHRVVAKKDECLR